MIKFDGQYFIITNNVSEYIIGVDEEKKVYHVSFLPMEISKGINRSSQRGRMKPLPFELFVNINFEPLMAVHGVRYFWSLSSYRAIYNSHKIDKTQNGEMLTITMVDQEVNMVIDLVYEIYESSPAVRRYTRVTNKSDIDIVINHISTFTLTNFPFFNDNSENCDMYLHRFTSHWAWEGEHKVDRFGDLGIYTKMCRNGFTVENTSTWVCQSHIPYFIVEERNSNLYWAVQHEHSGPWRFELGASELNSSNCFYIQGGLGNDKMSQWNKTLRPGENFVTSTASLVTARGNIEEVYNAMHCHQAKVLINRSETDKKFPVIYNDWQYLRGDVNENNIIEQLDRIKDAGIEVYVIDAGWFTSTDPQSSYSSWWHASGDWIPDVIRFPNGMEKITEEIRKRGIIPGIWCEIEAVGKASKFTHENGNLLMKRGGKFVEDVERKFLYFGSDEGRVHADQVFERLIGYGFKYFKIDYNIDCAPGCDNSGDSLGQGIVEHIRGYYQWLEALRERHPDIIIESCSSGGMRLEYGMLSRADLSSITDQESYKLTGAILYNVSRCIHISQMGNWSTLKSTFDKEAYVMTLINSMAARMHVSGDIVNHTSEQKQMLKEGIGFYKSYRHIFSDASVYYHTENTTFESNDGLKVMQINSVDNKVIVIPAWRFDSSTNFINIKPKSVTEGEYKVIEFPTYKEYLLTSEEIQNNGLLITLPDKFSARILKLVCLEG